MRCEKDFLTVLRPATRTLIAFVTFTVLASIGIATLISYGIRSDNLDRRIRNERASNYVSSLYREAERASQSVQTIAPGKCTAAGLTRLRHVVAISPHIRSISLYREGEAGCSSLKGILPDPGPLPGRVVPFYTLQRDEDGYIFFRVYFVSGPVTTAVSLNGYFVRRAVSDISPDAAFYTREDYIRLAPPGYAWINSLYPFVLVSHGKTDIADVLSRNRVLIIFIVAISALAGWLTFLSTGLLNTPRYAFGHHLRRKCFYPVYQPVISLRTGRVAGLEVLMRCRTREGKTFPPSLFIPLAEQCGMMDVLTISLMKQVKKDFRFFSGANLYLAINISPEMMLNNDTVTHLLDFSRHAGHVSISVLAEITERQGMAMTPTFIAQTEKLRKSGWRIAVDDFGTGFSNLSSILQLQPDYLKIDKDFTGYSQAGGIPEVLLESILHISANTRIPVIAEGIETPAQFSYMKARGVWLFQGYLFLPPSDAHLAADFVMTYAVPGCAEGKPGE